MNYGEQVLSRMDHPGFLLCLLGAVVAFASGPLTRNVEESKRGKVNLIVKAAGCAVAFIGAILLFEA